MISKNDQQWLEQVLEKISIKMKVVRERSKEKMPAKALDGVHDDKRVGNYTQDDGINWWTNGFWAGILWQMYHYTKDERYREIASQTEIWLDEAFHHYNGLHHDVGFMWLPSSVAHYRLTGEAMSRTRSLHAANLLAGRFNINGRFIRAWNDIPGQDVDTRGWAIIDCLFNIPLLYWATDETKDPRYKQIAVAHADTVMNNFIRPDGSVEHIVEFNPHSGEKVTTYGGQGYEQGSSWTRGQTWAIYGFWMSYKHTGQQVYLDTAKKVAHYFIANIPEDGIIPVDFRQPCQPFLEDDTAAAIAACGFIEIAKEVGELERELYLKAALKMLKTLDKKRADYRCETDTILTHCSGSYHEPSHHYALVCADYYYIEALLKLKEADLFIW